MKALTYFHKDFNTLHAECRLFLCSVSNLEKQVEEMDIDADPSSWQPYSSFVEALREKIARAEPIGKTLFILRVCCISTYCQF